MHVHVRDAWIETVQVHLDSMIKSRSCDFLYSFAVGACSLGRFLKVLTMRECLHSSVLCLKVYLAASVLENSQKVLTIGVCSAFVLTVGVRCTDGLLPPFAPGAAPRNAARLVRFCADF